MTRTVIPAEEILTKAHSVGQYYGFTPLSTLTAKKRGMSAKAGLPDSLSALPLGTTGETVASFLKQCATAECAPTPRQPLFVWHTNIAPGRPAPKKANIQFHALGSDRALSVAVVMRAVLSLVRDLFREEPVLRINSMGDKETRARFVRELSTYFRKRATTMPEECLLAARHNALEAAEIAIEKACAEDLPAPTDHLSDASRKRFEDLLEYLEMTETPYELARDLIHRGDMWHDTCFEVLSGGQRVAWGSQYGELTKHFFPKAPFAAAGAVIQVASQGKPLVKNTRQRVRFSFVHIGDEAKRLSIQLAEDFRKARTPLMQDIGVESLTEQLLLAEKRESPYLLIMGRKEALEGSVMLRNRLTQEETILPLEHIHERLKAFA